MMASDRRARRSRARLPLAALCAAVLGCTSAGPGGGTPTPVPAGATASPTSGSTQSATPSMVTHCSCAGLAWVASGLASVVSGCGVADVSPLRPPQAVSAIARTATNRKRSTRMPTI